MNSSRCRLGPRAGSILGGVVAGLGFVLLSSALYIGIDVLQSRWVLIVASGLGFFGPSVLLLAVGVSVLSVLRGTDAEPAPRTWLLIPIVALATAAALTAWFWSAVRPSFAVGFVSLLGCFTAVVLAGALLIGFAERNDSATSPCSS